jgi:hypothetical protein
MTVRAWFTISAVALAALPAAFAVQILRPVPPPEILVRVGEQRLDGALESACWPQRNGQLRCTKGDEKSSREEIPDEGSLRVVLASPAQPQDGFLRIEDSRGKTIVDADEWERTVDYELDPGEHTITIQAGRSGPNQGYVRYVFAVNVTRSGS